MSSRLRPTRSGHRPLVLEFLASGQNSTLTGALAAQIVMEGFVNTRLRPWLRRLITRAIAIVYAVTALRGVTDR